MTVRDLTDRMGLKIAAGEKGINREITGCYICDLLSWVMSHGRKGNAWITIHTHLNVVAVAVLCEFSCIIIPHGIEVNSEMAQKADEEAIPVLLSEYDSYKISCQLERLGV